VYGVRNVIADHLSHDKVADAQECARNVFGQTMTSVPSPQL
jgi:hypothetical protein